MVDLEGARESNCPNGRLDSMGLTEAWLARSSARDDKSRSSRSNGFELVYADPMRESASVVVRMGR